MRKILIRPNRPYYLAAVIVTLGVVAVGVFVNRFSRASGLSVVAETESGRTNGVPRIDTDTQASGGAFVRFGPGIPLGKASPGGTYADWYFPGSGLSSIEWAQVPLVDPAHTLTTQGLLHYYAYTFGVNNATSAVGNGYAGFQTNGIFQGTPKGEAINFSIWGNTGGRAPSPSLINPSNPESGGYQIMLPYSWSPNTVYSFQLKQGPSGIDGQGKWWGLWVTNTANHVTTFVGEERVPTTIGGHDSSLLSAHTGAFGEDTHWWHSLNGSVHYRCSDFQNSSMAYVRITANNGSVTPNNLTTWTNSGQPSVDQTNGYATTNCTVTEYTDTRKNVQMNLGYWSTAAANGLGAF